MQHIVYSMKKRRNEIKTTIDWFFFSAMAAISLFLFSCQATPPHGAIDLSRSGHNQALQALDEINVLNGQGKYAQAVSKAKTLLEIVEQEKGDSHASVASCLNVLGGLYISLGDEHKAIPLLERALDIHTRRGLEDDPEKAIALGLLAKAYCGIGDLSQAKSFAHRAYDLRQAIDGTNHLLMSTSLITLGDIYTKGGDYRQAERFYFEALTLRKALRNPHSLLIALNKLIELYYYVQDYQSALKVGTTALELGRKYVRMEHEHMLHTLRWLALVQAARGDFEQAFTLMSQARDIESILIQNMSGYTSEKQKVHFLKTINENQSIFLALIAQAFPNSPEKKRAAFDSVVTRKGMILELQRRFQEALFKGDPKALALFDQLCEVRALLTTLAFSEPNYADFERYKKTVRELSAKSEQLEIQLNEISRAYTDFTFQRNASLETIARKLPYRSALVEIVQVRDYSFQADTPMKDRWLGESYYAFVVRSDAPRRVDFISLGDASRIDQIAADLKTAVIRNKRGKAIQDTFKAADMAHSVLFEKIEQRLDGITTVFISPDSNLNLLPFEILRTPSGRFLVEAYRLIYLSCSRDILGFGNSSRHIGGTSYIYGNPDFNTVNRPYVQEMQATDDALERGLPHLLADIEFCPLPGTEAEATAIMSIMGDSRAILLLGKAATETALFEMESPKILHIATHGFFITDIEPDSSKPIKPRGVSIKPAPLPSPDAVQDAMQNPLLRSGLAFAGANIRTPGGRRVDGIVTAEKILNLRLHGTDLVTLSACETGIGNVLEGEGVFGLRRAFIQAGARSLVMSMWSVPDAETKALMEGFYQNIFHHKLNHADAFRKAMLDQIYRLRVTHGYADPYLWGAFIFYGEPYHSQ